jgi:DNA-binding IclR family transcriptional regulator
MTIKSDGELAWWSLAVVKALGGSNEPLSRAELVSATGLPRGHVSRALRWLKHRRLTICSGHRWWRLSQTGEIAAQANGYVTGLSFQPQLFA